MWAPEAGAWVATLPHEAGGRLGVDGDRLVTVGDEWTEWIVGERPAATSFSNDAGLTTVRTAPDGGTLVTLDGSGVLRAWELPGGRLAAERAWQGSVLKDGDFSVDGETFLTSSALGGAAAFETTDWALVEGSVRPGARRRVVAMSDGFVLVRYERGHLERRGGHGATAQKVRFVGPTGLHDAAARADGSAAVFVGDGHTHRLDAGGETTRELPGIPEARAVAVANASPRLVVGTADGVRRHDPDTGAEQLRYPGSDDLIIDVAISPDDRLVAATTLDGQVRVWELESGRPVLSLRAHAGRAASVDFEPDGRGLWTAGWDGTARRIALTDVDRPADALVEQARERWGLSLDEALDAVARQGHSLR